MDIIGGIGAASEGIKLLNELRKVDREIDKADLKLRLVDVADKLLDAKQALQDAQEREFSLQKRVAELEERLTEKGRFEDQDGLLYRKNEVGQREGEPYCNYCYVKEEKLFRLVHGPYDFGAFYCKNCSDYYGKAEQSARSGIQTGWDVGDPYKYD